MNRTPKIVRSIHSEKSPGSTYTNAQSPSKNSLLAGLPGEELDRLNSCAQPFPMHAGQALADIATPVEYFYFPKSGVICTSAAMNDGRTVALGVIGREGFVGARAFLGAGNSQLRAAVLIEGTALKVSRLDVQHLLAVCPQFAASLYRYSCDYLTQIATTGACHALHNVPQRVAAWLLMIRDRTDLNALPLTHESLSELLGCRRSSVTKALSCLQSARVIRCGRGQIVILSRGRLEQQVCECYAALKHMTFG